MLFSTPVFVFLFLPVFFALYWFLPGVAGGWERAVRSGILLLGSLFFYSWGEPVFVWVFLASACFDWLLGWQIAGQGRWRRWALALGVAGNIGLLVYAKYTRFAFENLNVLLGSLHLAPLTLPSIALPLGVSFIVFEKITYLVDLYRGVSKPAHSLLHYVNYVFLFPKLLAGPIVKYHDISEQLVNPSHRYEDVRDGLIRFIVGLGKKMLIADLLSTTVDKVFNLGAAQLNPSTAWLGIICFTLQIYFDFAGYSDMAIGLARILGFRLQENFRDPYLATSITDFWRRWHISLSTWIKEYLYFPLGGSRVSVARSYANLCICFFLSGLWHGASWNFVIWGCYHGVGLVADRMFWLEWQKRLPRLLNVAITFLLAALGWVFFRCGTFGHACDFFAALFGLGAHALNDVFLTNDTRFVLIVAAVLVVAPLVKLPKLPLPEMGRIPALAGAAVLYVLCVAWMGISTFHPFLYFRF
ncbi:MAG: MBOAT family protein [Chthoniobacteraceae bacterium]|nr:MBOAT family protein [Chthoniobacteraceae bacterium]